MGMANQRLINHEKIIEKGSIKKFKIEFIPYYGLMSAMFVLFMGLLYVCGIDMQNWYANIGTVSYFILLPLIVSAFLIDLKEQIIPNRLVLTIFEIGLIFTFLDGIFSPSGMTIALNRLEGMIVGAGIFLIITLLGGIIAGKEAMGMGDVKLMGALGLFFGLSNIMAISMLSFVIGAVASIFLLLFKIKKPNEYVPFGPFIVIAVIIAMVVPKEILLDIFWFIFSGKWYSQVLKK